MPVFIYNIRDQDRGQNDKVEHESENISKTKKIDIPDQFVHWSPFLSTLISTDNTVEMIDDCYSLLFIEQDISLENYLDLLIGKIKSYDDIDNPYIFYVLLGFMGHANTSEYPKDVFVAKTINQYWRDFAFLDIHEPFSGLIQIPEVKIPMKNYVIENMDCSYSKDFEHINRKDAVFHVLRNILHLDEQEGCYIAGSFAMYLAGHIHEPNDCDIFVTDPSKIIEIFKDENVREMFGEVSINNNTIDFIYSFPDVLTYRYDDIENTSLKNCSLDNKLKFQIVLLIYKSPDSIVHRFDIDCCQVIYDLHKNSLWTTCMGLFSHKNKKNYFDPNQATKSYIYRLIKYACRSYQIYLPFFENMTHHFIDKEKLKELLGNECINTRANYDSFPQYSFVPHRNIDLLILYMLYGIVYNDLAVYNAYKESYSGPHKKRHVIVDQENYEILMKYSWVNLDKFHLEISGKGMPESFDKEGYRNWILSSTMTRKHKH